MKFFSSLLLCIIFETVCCQQLVLPGDFPDPSVVKIGDTYWSSATTSNWAPAYPLLSSKDLVSWELRGYAFSKLPSWADYYFWAPEISYDNGKVFMYYSAHKKGGNLCVAVASADKPEGPYTDHGPLICQEAGSIDAFPMRDENGKLYLIWKEDGNSVNLPTPIWAAEMNEERTALTGEKKELFRNDSEWEGNLVEGVSMIRAGEFFYAFYAGAGCCGRGCTYGVGVARARNLLGPWEKYNGNPLLKTSEKWKCPGHGTPVDMNGKHYFLYHAYSSEGDVYAGRQGLLKEFVFSKDGWIEFKNQAQASGQIKDFADQFNGKDLSPDWQWSVFKDVRAEVAGNELKLNSLPGKSGAFLGTKTFTADYEASVEVMLGNSTGEGGLALIGDDENLIGATVKDHTLRIWKLEKNNETILSETQLKNGRNRSLVLLAAFTGGKNVIFSYCYDRKKRIMINDIQIDPFFLPPWDRAVRAGLISKGSTDQYVIFDNFRLINK